MVTEDSHSRAHPVATWMAKRLQKSEDNDTSLCYILRNCMEAAE